MPERHVVKYTFLKVDPAWRRLPDEERAAHKREFVAACEDFASERLLRAFSTVGTRGDTDLMLLSQATNLERIHEFHVVLAQSGLMKWCTQPYSFLAMTKPSEYSDESRLEVRPAHAQVPLRLSVRQDARVVRAAAPTSAGRSCRSTSRSASEYPDIDLNTSYSFGLDDQEFVVAFEGDDPARFLDLVQRLRTTEASRYTKRDTPTFTCVAASVERALSALDGDAARRDGRRLGCPPCSRSARRVPPAPSPSPSPAAAATTTAAAPAPAEDPVTQVPSGLQEQVSAAQDPQESDFPATEGQTLQEVADAHRRRPRDGPGRLRLPRGRAQPASPSA